MTAARAVAQAGAPALVLSSGALIVVASLALSFWPALQDHHLTLAQNMADAGGKIIGSLFVVALILERALAVFNDLLFGQERAAARQNDAAGEDGAADQVDTARERARLVLGLGAGLLISAAGVRTLGRLTDAPSLDSFQTAVDILLTAGLLAGGSNGLAKLIDVLHESAAQRVSALRLQGAQSDARRREISRATQARAKTADGGGDG